MTAIFKHLPRITSEGGLNKYLRDIRKYPLLEPKYERDLAMKWTNKKDIESVSRSLKKGWISSEGPDVIKFEKKVSKFIFIPYSYTKKNKTKPISANASVKAIPKNIVVLTIPAASGWRAIA